MKKPISVALCAIMAFALIFSAPASLLLLLHAKAQIGSMGTAGAHPLPSPFQIQLRTAPPVANAGTNQIVSPGTIIILNGSGSYDPNRGGSIVYYRWVQVAGIPVSLVGSSGSSNTPYPRFTAPLNPNTVLTFSLTVMDNYGFTSTNPSSVSVLVSTQQQQLQQKQLQQQPQPQQSNGPLPGVLNAPSPNSPFQYQYPYHPPNTGILTPSPNSPYQYPNPYLYHYPPYQYPPNQAPGNNNNNNNKPFALKQGNTSTVTSNPLNINNAVPHTPGGGVITTNTSTTSPFLSSVKQQSQIISARSHHVINNTTTSVSNATSGTIKPSQRSASLTPPPQNNLTNALQQPSKTSLSNAARNNITAAVHQPSNTNQGNGSNATKSPNQTIANIRPRAVAAVTTPTNQVSGGGNGVLTCPGSTSTVNVGSSFNAANDQNGRFIAGSGSFFLETLQLPILMKNGTFTNATITPSGFVLTGTENADAICGSAPGASVMLSGPCNMASGITRFTASNGEKANITGTQECIIPPPSVTSTNPADGATGVPTSTSITATFNEAVKRSTVNSNSFTLSLQGCFEGCSNIAGTVSLSSDGMIATFTPTSSLAPSTNYTATISADVQNLDGINMTSPKTWSFTTGAVSSPSTIAITSVSNTSPRWGIDPVSVSGSTTNAAGDTVTVDWGDHTANTTGITVNNDGSWSTPVGHKYASSSAGTQPTIVAQLIQSCGEFSTCAGPFDSKQLTTIKAHTTTLTLAALSSITAGTSLDAIGQLVDQDAPGTSQLAGKSITFTGSGAVFQTVEPNNAAPVRTAGVNFTDPTGFVNIHSCSNCVLDSSPGGTTGNNKVMHLHASSTMTFGPGVTQVTLSIQDMGTSSFTYDYTTSDGAVHTGNQGTGVATSAGFISDLHVLGGVQSNGITPLDIKQITIRTVTDSSPTAPDNPVPGTVGISKMILQNVIGDPTDIQTIDFEDLTAGSSTYTATTANPFVLEAGLYFSVGKSQSTPQNNPLLQVQAHFAGNNAYLPADSTPQSYITLASTSALGAAGEATPIAYSGQVYSTVTCTADVDADGICDSWETPNTGQYTVGPTPTGCPSMHDCIPITTSTGAHLFYDLCFIDAFSNVWSPTSPANTLVCPTVGHKDIFVQLSWMQGHQPDPNAIKLVIKAFGNAPLTDTVAPNGLPLSPHGGVALHVVVANGISATSYATPNQATFNVWQDDCSRFTNCDDLNNANDFRHVKLNNFGTNAEVHGTGSQWASGCTTTPTAGAIQCPRDAKAQVYHYGLFIRTFGGPSGVSELPGNDFIVSLGTGFSGSDGFGGTLGSTDEQAGTFMHELGHNLDLDHGGPHKFLTSTGSLAGVPSSADVVVNCKANYISVMGYTRQLPAASFIGSGTPWETQGLDYSRITPNTVQSSLNEAALSEPAGVPYPKANTVVWGTSSTSIHTHATGANIDWNQIGGVSGTVSVDANNVGITNCPLPTASSLQTYNSYDDWDNLQYNFRAGTSYLDGVYPAVDRVPEQTGQMYQTIKNNFFNGEGFTLLQPVVKSGKCGSCTAGSSIPIKFTLKDASGKLITTAKVTFTAQQINPTTGAPIGNLIVGPIPSFTIDSTGQYQYNWKSPTVPGTYVIDLYLNYNQATQQLIVGSGQNGITIQLTLS